MPCMRVHVCVQVGREDEFSIDRRQMHARILVCMGGTVAEELVSGREHVTSGATDDLRQVRGGGAGTGQPDDKACRRGHR